MTDLDQRAKLLDDNVRLSKEIERLEAELNRGWSRSLSINNSTCYGCWKLLA
jgi:uncharacterized small protein (DUF1192 family)